MQLDQLPYLLSKYIYQAKKVGAHVQCIYMLGVLILLLSTIFALSEVFFSFSIYYLSAIE